MAIFFLVVIIANVANGSYEYLAKFGYYLNMCNFVSGGGHVCSLWHFFFLVIIANVVITHRKI